MQLKELLRQLKEGEVIGFEKLDDAVAVRVTAGLVPPDPNNQINFIRDNWKSRTLTTQQITGSGSDLVRDAIEDMLREVRK